MSARTVLNGESEVRAAVGSLLGTTEPFDITADRLAQFAEATGDPDATYFAISISNMFLPQIVEVHGFALGVNYGTDLVRLHGQLAAGDRVRTCASLLDVIDVKGGIQTRMLITVEDGDGRPVCSIESLSRWLS